MWDKFRRALGTCWDKIIERSLASALITYVLILGRDIERDERARLVGHALKQHPRFLKSLHERRYKQADREPDLAVKLD